MLVIPAIELRDGCCPRSITDEQGELYSGQDLKALALLWRRENAKTLHIFDFNGLYGGTERNRETVLAAVEAVEIPVQLVSRFADVPECEWWLDHGVYRLFVHDLIINDPVGVAGLVARFGPSRICAGAISRGGHITSTWRRVEEMDIVAFALRACELGICRSFFTDRDYEGVLHGPNFDELRRFATNTTLKITAAGGIATVEHLWMLQEMDGIGIDSVVIGRALYENCFPCQALWRDIERRRREQGDGWNGGGVSTARLSGDTNTAPDAGDNDK